MKDSITTPETEFQSGVSQDLTSAIYELGYKTQLLVTPEQY